MTSDKNSEFKIIVLLILIIGTVIGLLGTKYIQILNYQASTSIGGTCPGLVKGSCTVIPDQQIDWQQYNLNVEIIDINNQQGNSVQGSRTINQGGISCQDIIKNGIVAKECTFSIPASVAQNSQFICRTNIIKKDIPVCSKQIQSYPPVSCPGKSQLLPDSKIDSGQSPNQEPCDNEGLCIYPCKLFSKGEKYESQQSCQLVSFYCELCSDGRCRNKDVYKKMENGVCIEVPIDPPCN